MIVNENDFDPLESIIKIEPEEFEAIPVDDVMRSRAKIVSDPIVHVERLTLETLSRKGNKALRSTKDPHTCCFCSKTLSNLPNLKEHIKSVHFKTEKFLCDLCPKLYYTKRSIYHHLAENHREKKFKCNKCDLKFAFESWLELHKTTHAVKVKCSICKKQVSSLRRHMITHRPREKCPICLKMIRAADRRSMKSHMKSHNKKCGKCGETFESREALRRHDLTNHYDGYLYKCHCGAVYKSIEVLKHHQKSHGEKVDCKVCHMQFSSLENMKAHWKRKHVKTHGKLPHNKNIVRALERNGVFVCDKCGFKCLSRNAIRRHIHLYHMTRKLLLCDLCPRSYILKYSLVAHFQRDHQKVLPFKCTSCDYIAVGPYKLKRHMLVHGPKTKCKVCHKLVTDITQHLRSHAKAKSASSGRNSLQKDSSRHMRTSKGDKKASKNPSSTEKDTSIYT